MVFVVAHTAAADRLDSLGKRLSHEDARVRTAAVLALSKLQNPKAIPLVVGRLRDKDRKVRASACSALGQMVTPKTKPKNRVYVLKALRGVSEKDRDKFVRRKAKQTLARIGRRDFPVGATYVEVDKMAANDGKDRDLAMVMRRVTIDTVRKNGKGLYTTWPTGSSPTKKQLRAKRAQAFLIGGTVSSVKVSDDGDFAEISCRVSMYIASYPRKAIKATASGGGNVQVSSGAAQIKDGASECITAVVENLTRRKLIPGIGALSQ